MSTPQVRNLRTSFNVPIGHPSTTSPIRMSVVDPVEKLLDVEVRHDAAARRNHRLRRAHRLMRRPSGPKPVARGAERSVPMRLQNLQDRLLDEAVENRRNAERANAPGRLGCLDPPRRPRFVGAVKQLDADRRPMVLQVRGQGFDAHAVDPRRALVALNLRQRLPQIVLLDNRFPCAVRKAAGLSTATPAASASVPPARTVRASPVAPSPKASPSWIFDRLANARAPPYSPFQPFGPSADTQAYYAPC